MTEKEFVEKHCKMCGTQRCEGIGTEWFDGCGYRNELDGYEDKNEHIDIEEINRIYKHINHLFNKQVKTRISTTDTNGSIIYGWICPRCGKVLAPDVKECTCKSEPKSNINNSFYNTVEPSGFCKIEHRYTWCPQTPSYECCHFCSDWVECIPV